MWVITLSRIYKDDSEFAPRPNKFLQCIVLINDRKDSLKLVIKVWRTVDECKDYIHLGGGDVTLHSEISSLLSRVEWLLNHRRVRFFPVKSFCFVDFLFFFFFFTCGYFTIGLPLSMIEIIV